MHLIIWDKRYKTLNFKGKNLIKNNWKWLKNYVVNIKIQQHYYIHVIQKDINLLHNN